jgi:hypothetical protein
LTVIDDAVWIARYGFHKSAGETNTEFATVTPEGVADVAVA